MATAQEYMAMSRPVDQQLDLKNVLNALGGAMLRPQTSYAGLTADQVNNNAAFAANALAKQAQLMQTAQDSAVQQERQQFIDAMQAQQMNFQEQQLAIQRAAQALQAAAHAREAELAPLRRQLLAGQVAAQENENHLASQMGNFLVDYQGRQIPANMAIQLMKAQSMYNPTTFDKQGAFEEEVLKGLNIPASYWPAIRNAGGLAKIQSDIDDAYMKAMSANDGRGKKDIARLYGSYEADVAKPKMTTQKYGWPEDITRALILRQAWKDSNNGPLSPGVVDAAAKALTPGKKEER